jgi:plasmid rolling circle replication initiator protein Rep
MNNLDSRKTKDIGGLGIPHPLRRSKSESNAEGVGLTLESSEGRLPLLVHKQISSQNESTKKEIIKELIAIEKENQADRFSNCGKEPMLFRCDCKYHLTSKKCNLYRLCDVCAKKTKNDLFNKFINPLMRHTKFVRDKRLKTIKGLRMLTLTIENVDDIYEGVKEIKSSFSRFRRRKYIKARIFGGLAVVEFVRSKKYNNWNVHIHALVYSTYLDMKKKEKNGNSKVVNEWIKATKNKGSIVDIRMCGNHKKSLRYLLKYVTKLSPDLTPKQKVEVYDSLFNSRLVITFGTLYNIGEKPISLCPDCSMPYEYVSDYMYYEEFGTYINYDLLKKLLNQTNKQNLVGT